MLMRFSTARSVLFRQAGFIKGLLLICCILLCAQEARAYSVTVGTGTSTQRYPLGMYYGYMRSASVYLGSEIATTGNITSVSWYVNSIASSYPIGNVKIYLATTASTTIPAGTWTAQTLGATLVYDGTPSSLTAGQWNTFPSTGFYFSSTAYNLVVMVETNYGGSGNGAGSTGIAVPYNSVASGGHRYWEADTNPPTSNGTATANRPNIQMNLEPPPAMSYQSLTSTQVTGMVAVRTPNIEILRVVVNTTGFINALNANSFTFNTNGTTDATNIGAAKVYYTGSSPAFSTVAQFGSTVNNPNGAFTVSGTQALSNGPNYFWLVYDQSPTHTGVGNVLDGELVSASIGGSARTPTVGAPAGNRQMLYIAPIGQGTSVVRRPFGMYYGYERSASLYKGSEIGIVGRIDSIAWNLVNPGTVTGNVKVYLKRTSDAAVPSADWATMIAGATLVYDGSPTFRAGTWGLPIAPFSFTNTSENLYILIETNFGGSGGEGTADKAVAYTTVTGMHSYLMQDTSPPTSTMSADGNRPNIILFVTPPKELTFSGSTALGNVGSTLRRTVTLGNNSPLVPLNVTNVTATGSASSYRIYQPGTSTPMPTSFAIPALGSQNVDIVFGTQGISGAGQQDMNVVITHDGSNSPYSIPVTGFYASITAMDGTTNLLAPNVKFNVGGLQPGAGQISKEFRLGTNVALPAGAPIVINSYTLTGTDAALFNVTALPTGIIGDNLISVSLRESGAQPGTKTATLTINHSGANGPVTVIQIEGRIGQPIIAAPTLVMLPPVALGQTYTSPYENVRLIPITRAGAVDVQFLQTPQLAGSGASRMELVSNSGFYFIRGQFGPGGNVIIGGDGNIANPANWINPNLRTISATETQPLLLAVRMRPATSGVPAGSYDATMMLSNGSGTGLSNAVNAITLSIVGEVLNDPQRVALYPGQIAFGSVPVATSSARTLTLRNQSGVAGMATLTITGNEFSFDGGQRSTMVMLPANNAAMSVEVWYNPMGSGASNGVITASGVISGTVALSGSGQAANPGNLVVMVDGQTPASIVNFGNVGIGQTGSKTITVINNNVGPVTISSIGRSGANATQFVVVDPMTWEIPGNGGSVSFTVKFMPTSLSNPQKEATITIYNSTGVPKGLNVRGTAVNAGGSTVSVTLSPSNYNFGNQNGTYTFVLNNMSGNAVTVSGALILGSSNFTVMDAASSFPRTVSAGGSTSITVMFNSTMGDNGSRSGSLVVITPSISPYPTSTLTGVVGTSALGRSGVLSPVESNSVVYPNPFAGETEVRYTLQQGGTVSMVIYDQRGREVLRSELGNRTAGEHREQIDLRSETSGQYFYRIETGVETFDGVLVLKR